MNFNRAIGLGIAILSLGWGCAMADVELTRDGATRCVIVLPNEPAEAERQAADELADHLSLISGAEIQVVEQGNEPKGLLHIRLGDAADPKTE